MIINPQQYTTLIEILGTATFAMSGSFLAIQKRLDPFGVIFLAFVTAVGGGTVRDVLLDVPVFWMHNMKAGCVILISAILAMVFRSIENKLRYFFFTFDALGLGLFSIIGVSKAAHEGLNPIICVTLAIITGTFGGLIRDILVNRIPLILRKEIYATPCLIGASSYLLLRNFSSLSNSVIQVLCILLVFGIRLLAVKYQLKIPKFYKYLDDGDGH
jgi:uncharacterized membrane protein YeiH